MAARLCFPRTDIRLYRMFTRCRISRTMHDNPRPPTKILPYQKLIDGRSLSVSVLRNFASDERRIFLCKYTRLFIFSSKYFTIYSLVCQRGKKKQSFFPDCKTQKLFQHSINLFQAYCWRMVLTFLIRVFESAFVRINISFV